MHACVVQDLMMLGTRFGERFEEPNQGAGWVLHAPCNGQIRGTARTVLGGDRWHWLSPY